MFIPIAAYKEIFENGNEGIEKFKHRKVGDTFIDLAQKNLAVYFI